jgi:hypothetical protein
MSNVVNVVGRKRVQARKDLINRALGTELVTAGIYVYKHSIVIDSSVALPQPRTKAPAQANDPTTYDINDKTPILETEADVLEEFRLQRDLRGWSREEE